MKISSNLLRDEADDAGDANAGNEGAGTGGAGSNAGNGNTGAPSLDLRTYLNERGEFAKEGWAKAYGCLLYTSPSPRDRG